MDFRTALTPLWEGDTVFAESVLFYPDPRTGEIGPAPLFYPADEILRVTSSDFMIEYKENTDYYLENGRLFRTPDSDKQPSSASYGSDFFTMFGLTINS